jgi:excisionase family DNA binding protein
MSTKDHHILVANFSVSPQIGSNETLLGGAMEQRWLRVEEAAEALGLGRTKTCELIGNGELGSVMVGGSRRVPVAAIEAFAKSVESGFGCPKLEGVSAEAEQ